MSLWERAEKAGARSYAARSAAGALLTDYKQEGGVEKAAALKFAILETRGGLAEIVVKAEKRAKDAEDKAARAWGRVYAARAAGKSL